MKRWWWLLLCLPLSAAAHLLPARQGTINVVGDSAYVMISIPATWLKQFDDNRDGRLSAAETQRHDAGIRAHIKRGLILSEHGRPGIVAFDSLLLPDASAAGFGDRHPSDDHLIAMQVVQFSKPPTALSIRTNLFVRDDPAALLSLLITAGKPREIRQTIVLTPRQPQQTLLHDRLANSPGK